MTPGTVLFDTRFEFKDGTFGRKLIVLLNDGTCGYYIVVKTTSSAKHKGQNAGCQSKDRYPNFFIPANSCFLIGDSYVMLQEFHERTAFDLVKKKFSGLAKHIGVLDKNLTIQLLECAISAKDISTENAKELKATLQKLKAPEPTLDDETPVKVRTKENGKGKEVPAPPATELSTPPPKTQA